MSERHIITEALAEKLIDDAVQRRLGLDHRYLYAENAEEQAEAERQIELEETARIAGKYRIV